MSDAMKVIFTLWMLSCTRATENEETDQRFSVVSSAQEIADSFIGAVWNRVGDSEFVGGTADVYLNKQDQFPIVETSDGKVKGIVSLTSREQLPYSAFLGIPFAKPPTGLLRFKAPQEPEPWTDIRDGTYERATCLTFREPNKGKEDCLYLNVFTPTSTPETADPNKPVMVFIYGGAFMGGSSNASGYGPDFLLEKDAVVVTFNYRIGPLGFLSINTEDAPGNAGLKDQNMVLRWVQRNIENFGGDSKKVTIFGESAGAASVAYHVMSSLSKGLFHRAIMESGSSMAPWAFTDPESAVQKAFNLGQRVGCTLPASINSANQLLACLRETPAPLLTRMQPIGISMEDIFALRPLAFVPTMEPDHPGAMVTKRPLEYFETADYNRVPLIMGVNTAEGLLIYPTANRINTIAPGLLIRVLEQDLTKFLPADINNTLSEELRNNINTRMHKFYTRSTGGSMGLLQLLQVISDTEFLIPMMRMANYFTKDSEVPLHIYQFSFDGPYTCYKTTDDLKALNGTAHMDELGYLFNLGPLRKAYHHSQRNKAEEKVIDMMTQLWRDFADSGEPPAWPQFTRENTAYLDLGATAVQKTNIENEAITFWNEIYKMVTGHLQMPQN